jgi:hypothetical protein
MPKSDVDEFATPFLVTDEDIAYLERETDEEWCEARFNDHMQTLRKCPIERHRLEREEREARRRSFRVFARRIARSLRSTAPVVPCRPLTRARWVRGVRRVRVGYGRRTSRGSPRLVDDDPPRPDVALALGVAA